MVVAFIGHRKVECARKLENILMNIISNLIINENADTFLFGSKSQFDNVCYSAVSRLKSRFNYINRVYVRAEYEFIDKSYNDYLLESYENTYFPVEVKGAGKLSYIKRNQVMIDKCDVLIVYCDDNYQLNHVKNKSNSGTRTAVDYAKKKHIRIINLFTLL